MKRKYRLTVPIECEFDAVRIQKAVECNPDYNDIIEIEVVGDPTIHPHTNPGIFQDVTRELKLVD